MAINWCPECRARAEGFLLPATKDASCMKHWSEEQRQGEILARDTGAKLTEDWRQEVEDRKRPIIWRRDHKLVVDTFVWGRDGVTHITISNCDRTKGREHFHTSGKILCRLPEVIQLDGPGAAAHIKADAAAVAAVLAKADLEKRTKAREAAEAKEAAAFGEQIVSVLKMLGIEASASGPKGGFPWDLEGSFVSPENQRVSMSLKVAARVVEVLGGAVARPPTETMPLWKVWYDEEKTEGKEPLYVAARSQPAVVAYMTAHYCHERTEGDEPNIPLKPELLTIEDAGPDPDVPEDEEDAA